LQTLVKRRLVEIVMANKKTQIGFRVTEALRKRIEADCLKRGLSVQDLFTFAYEYYSKTPVKWDYSASTFVREEDEATDERVEELKSWTDLWLKYIHSMPREKILLHAEAMKLDIQHYKSSRRKK
jgi:hypothetical protein